MMHRETFLKEFGPLASGPGGVQKLRELVLQLAVRGKLVPQFSDDGLAMEVAARALAEVPDKIKKQLCDAPQPHIIPANWSWVTLGAISNYGQTEKVEPGGLDDPEFWVLELEDIEKTTSRLLARVPFRERDFRSSKNRFFKGQVLYGKLRPYLDKVLVADHEGCCTTEIVPFSVFGGIDPHFIRWCMKTPDFVAYANGSTHGMNLPRMGTKSAIAAPIPLPPVAEQKRIVAKVDELMALCDELEAQQAKEAWLKRATAASALDHLTEANSLRETADRWSLLAPHFGGLFYDPEAIRGLRGTILDLAVTGKLTERDIDDDIPDQALADIEAARQQMISTGIINRLSDIPEISEHELPYEVPSTWRWIRYNSAFRFIDYRGKTPPKTEVGIPLITAKNVRPGFVDREPREFISQKTFDDWMTRGFPEVEDILLTVEAPLGNAAVIDIVEPFALAQRVICLQRWDKASLSPEFAQIAISSPLGQIQLQSQATGMTATGIKAAKLKLIPLPFPPLAEQKRIVGKVNELMSLCDRLENQMHEDERLNADLMASLVHALTETDPDGGGAVEPVVLPKPLSEVAATEQTNRATPERPETESVLIPLTPEPKAQAAPDRGPIVDSKFQEAVLVAAIVNTFFQSGGEPIGNFRLQKAVYFARRKMGEHVDEMAYLKKAAGPYNPSMKYSGGIAIAKQKNWLREARGRFGFGHVPGPDVSEAGEWIDTYGYAAPARWVAEHFRYKKNDEWETLATVDYAIEHLQALGIEPDAAQILQYIGSDSEWRPKIEKLGLTEMSVGTAMLEVQALFSEQVQGGSA